MGDGENRNFALRLLVIAVSALGLRILLTVVVTPQVPMIGDAYYYHDLANTLAKGYGYVVPGSTEAGHAVPTAGHPPLWPGLLSIVSRLGGGGAPIGQHGLDGYTAHRLLGGLVGTGTVVAIGYLARRLAGARVGLIAALLAAVYPVLVAADGSLMPETLFGLCVAVSMLIAYRLLDAPNGWWALALGVAIGFAALARSEGLTLFAVLALPAAWQRGLPWQLYAARAGLAGLGILLVVVPWTIRNSERFDRLIVGSTNSGSVISGANCHNTYYGQNLGLWHVQCVGPALPDEAEAAARQRERGYDYARAHAGRLPLVMSVRVLRTWDLYQPWRGTSLNEGRDITISRIGLISYWLLLPFAVAGAILLFRRREPLRIVLAPVLLVTITSALGWGTTRFRHPADIAVILLAAVALETLYEAVRAPARRAPAARAVPERT